MTPLPTSYNQTKKRSSTSYDRKQSKPPHSEQFNVQDDRSHASTSKDAIPIEKIRRDQLHTMHSPSSSTTQSALCSQCSTPNTIFYCAFCLSERIISHHINVRRVDEMRQRGRREASKLLGSKEESESNEHVDQPLDPFDQNTQYVENATGYDIDHKRTLRAKRYRLARLTEEAEKRAVMLREDISRRRQKLSSLNIEQTKRRETLNKAILYRDAASVTGNEKDSMLQSISIKGTEMLRADVQHLKTENDRLGQKLAVTRSVLAQEIYTVFKVQPPAGTLASARAAQGKTALQSLSGRSDRSKERYIPGAFVFDQQSIRRSEQEKVKGSTKENLRNPVNPNDWTILGLVMPLSTDLKRFERQKINGAITYTVQLLELVTFYLGISLPFLISHSAGKISIRPNALWGSGTKQSLYLNSSSYSALSATESHGVSSGLGSMGASMISNLGASTMSTLESFVQLPSGKNLPWSKNTPVVDSSDPQNIRKEVIDEKTAAATKQFCTALTMLTYDVAYLAHQEGVQIDIVNAAGSILRILHRTVHSPKAGWKAHVSSNSNFRIDDLTFTELDFPQLAQTIEAGSVHSRTKQNIARSNATSIKGKDSQKWTKAATSSNNKDENAIMLDGSYIDARQAAQSILDIRKDDKRKSYPQTIEQQTTMASERTINMPSRERKDRKALPNRAGTLDFLHSSAVPQTNQAIGARGSKTSGSSFGKSVERKKGSGTVPSSNVAQQTKVRSEKPTVDRPGEVALVPSKNASSGGKVLFNGKEIKGKSTAELTKRGSSNVPIDGKKQDEDEDGWAVL